jgi:hypothetical protein
MPIAKKNSVAGDGFQEIRPALDLPFARHLSAVASGQWSVCLAIPARGIK